MRVSEEGDDPKLGKTKPHNKRMTQHIERTFEHLVWEEYGGVHLELWLTPANTNYDVQLISSTALSLELSLQCALLNSSGTHYVLIILLSCPSVLNAVPAIMETNKMLWLFFLCCGQFFPYLPLEFFPHLCTFPQVHSDSFSNLPAGICWHLWVLILMLWLLFLKLRRWLAFSHW